MYTRRDFLRTSAMTTAASVVGVAGAPKFAFGQQAGGGKTLIKVFMRGGADGLHLFPMVGDINYYRVRPNIAIEGQSSDPNSAISLPGHTGEMDASGNVGKRAMNPNLAPLMEIWDNIQGPHGLMVSPASAIQEGNRSHFDCQRWIGTGQRDNFVDGYLNRYLQGIDATDHPLRGASLGKSSIATEVRGQIAVPAISRDNNFRLRNGDFCEGNDCAENRLTDTMREISEISSHEVVRDGLEGQVREQQVVLLGAIDEVRARTIAQGGCATDSGVTGLEHRVGYTLQPDRRGR